MFIVKIIFIVALLEVAVFFTGFVSVAGPLFLVPVGAAAYGLLEICAPENNAQSKDW
jgi:hypothetical protein